MATVRSKKRAQVPVQAREGRGESIELNARQASKLRAIMEVVPHMMFAKDWEGRFLLANQAVAEAYGATPEDLIGISHQSVHQEESEVRQMLADDREVMRTGQPKFIPEETFVDSRGRQRVLQTLKMPFSMEDSDRRAVLGIAIDITETKRASERQRRLHHRLQEALGRLMGGFLPICASCKRIRDERGHWARIEEYIERYSRIRFTHGICPHCAQELYGKMSDKEPPVAASG